MVRQTIASYAGIVMSCWIMLGLGMSTLLWAQTPAQQVPVEPPVEAPEVLEPVVITGLTSACTTRIKRSGSPKCAPWSDCGRTCLCLMSIVTGR